MDIFEMSTDKYYYIGFFILIFIEYLFPRKQNEICLRSQETAANIAFFLIIEHLLAFIPTFIRINLILIMHSVLSKIGYTPVFINDQNVLFVYIISFIYIDFASYWVHRMLHTISPLWQLHKLHHSSIEVNISSDKRFNLLENPIFFLFSELPLLLVFGEGITHILINISIFSGVIFLFSHANVSFKLPKLSKFFATPQVHIWHHAVDLKFSYGQNYAAVLCIWDQLFGTFYWNPNPPACCGFREQDKYPTNIFMQILYPFHVLKPFSLIFNK